jgi:hypothetical protein
MAPEYAMNGNKYAEKLILNAENTLLANAGLVNMQGQVIKAQSTAECSTCFFDANNKAQSRGIVITSFNNSSIGYLAITSLKISTNHNGIATIIFEDEFEKKEITVVLSNVDINVVPISNYYTNSKTIKIYFKDPLIEVYQVNCAATSSCGCSGGSQTAPRQYNVSGIMMPSGIISPVQFGFLPCIEQGCDASATICNIIGRYGNILAMYMAYDVAENLFKNVLLSDRVNETKLKLDKEMVAQSINNFAIKKDEIMHGRKAGNGLNATNGIAYLLQNSLSSGDACVACVQQNYSATATF